MDKQRWSRKEVINGKPPISLWPKVLDTQIDECFRESFQNQCKAVEMYLDQYSLKDIEKATGVKCKSVQLLTQKCLDIANDGNVYGYPYRSLNFHRIFRREFFLNLAVFI